MPAPASETLLTWELGVPLGEPFGPSGLAQPHPALAADTGLSPSALWAPPGSSAPVLPPFLGSAAAPALLFLTSSSLVPSHKQVPALILTFAVTTPMTLTWTSPTSYLVSLPLATTSLLHCPNGMT